MGDAETVELSGSGAVTRELGLVNAVSGPADLRVPNHGTQILEKVTIFS